MSKIFEVDYRQGSLVEKINKIVPTLTGTLPFSKAEKGMALRNRQGGYYSYGAISAVNSLGVAPFTAEVAFTYQGFKNVGSIYNCLFSNSNLSSSSGLGFFYTSDNILRFFVIEGATPSNVYANSAMVIGNKYHAVATFDGTTYRLYVNGVLQTSTTTSVRNINISNALIVGNDVGLGRNALVDLYTIRIHNNVLTTQEINASYNNFLAGDGYLTQKRNISSIKPTDLSRLKDTGLVAAYNMQPQGNILVDISGNGYNLAKTLGGSNTSKKGMTNTGKENWTTTPTMSLDTDFSLSFRVLKKHTGTTLNTLFRTTNGTTTGIWVYLDSGVNGRLTIDNNVTPAHFNGALPVVGQEYTITLTYLNSSNTTNCYINGVFFGTSTAYAPTSPRTSILRVLYSGGAGNDNGLSELQDLRIYNRILTTQEIKDYHNSFNDITLIEDFSDQPANNATAIVPTGWELVSGTFKVGENAVAVGNYGGLPIGSKYLECTSNGTLAIPSQQAYGTWEFDFYKGGDNTRLSVDLVSSKTRDNLPGSYMFYSDIDEALYLRRGGENTALKTANSYITNSTWYRARITRTITGVFTVMIKGGAFIPTAGYDGYTLVSTTGGSGSNPVTDNNYTVSNYLLLDIDNGDRVANIKLIPYIKQ